MKTKHTKREWDYPRDTYHQNNADDYCIYIRTDRFTVGSAYGKTLEEAEANAKLIVAAPKMLIQLEGVKNNLEALDELEVPLKSGGCLRLDILLEDVKEAIKKATE